MVSMVVFHKLYISTHITKTGEGAQVLTEEQHEIYDKHLNEVLPDETLRNWAERGGSFE